MSLDLVKARLEFAERYISDIDQLTFVLIENSTLLLDKVSKGDTEDLDNTLLGTNTLITDYIKSTLNEVNSLLRFGYLEVEKEFQAQFHFSPGFLEDILEGVEEVINDLIASGENILNNTINLVTGEINEVLDPLTPLLDTVNTNLDTEGNNILARVQKLFDTIINRISSEIDSNFGLISQSLTFLDTGFFMGLQLLSVTLSNLLSFEISDISDMQFQLQNAMQDRMNQELKAKGEI